MGVRTEKRQMPSWISIVYNLDKDENISLCKRQAFIYSAVATPIDNLTTKSYTSRMKSDPMYVFYAFVLCPIQTCTSKYFNSMMITTSDDLWKTCKYFWAIFKGILTVVS